MTTRFANRVVVVTGGGRGLGRAVALGFAAEGARLVLVSRTQAELAASAEAIARQGGSGVPALVHRADVTEPAAVDVLAARVKDHFGVPDVVINAAGVFKMTPALDTDAQTLRDLFDANTTSAFNVSRAFGKEMIARGSGKIVNFASLLSFVAFPGRAGYAAAKGALLQLTRTLGIEWAPHGVNVNAIVPGMIAVETPHPATGKAAVTRDQIRARIPCGRVGTPADIVGPTLFLASRDADYMFGQSLVVDGGWLSHGWL